MSWKMHNLLTGGVFPMAILQYIRFFQGTVLKNVRTSTDWRGFLKVF